MKIGGVVSAAAALAALISPANAQDPFGALNLQDAPSGMQSVIPTLSPNKAPLGDNLLVSDPAVALAMENRVVLATKIKKLLSSSSPEDLASGAVTKAILRLATGSDIVSVLMAKATGVVDLAKQDGDPRALVQRILDLVDTVTAFKTQGAGVVTTAEPGTATMTNPMAAKMPTMMPTAMPAQMPTMVSVPMSAKISAMMPNSMSSGMPSMTVGGMPGMTAGEMPDMTAGEMPSGDNTMPGLMDTATQGGDQSPLRMVLGP